ncbi:MAG TPA: phosphate-starvation-inducible PsiE family protein, partial [Dongiaceae bacterium]|nr:phosphate-starvation-inducible PsiE family protein [Dongiaceae bacterium]
MAGPERIPRIAAARRAEPSAREAAITGWLARAFGRVEDVVYVGLAVVLAALALGLLVDGVIAFAHALMSGDLAAHVAMLLDRMLLILMVVEILYTVQVSLREHTLVPEPFLVVGLIAGIRRILVLTAEFSDILERGGATFGNAMLELGVLTAMVLALVGALVLLRR